MYQSLIWAGKLGDDPRRLGAPLDAENRKRLAHALVDRMRRNAQLDRDLLRAEMLVDETKAIELTLGQPHDALGHRVVPHVR
jgi:hypothetical protein